jgi:hypothetical protein
LSGQSCYPFGLAAYQDCAIKLAHFVLAVHTSLLLLYNFMPKQRKLLRPCIPSLQCHNTIPKCFEVGVFIGTLGTKACRSIS